MRLGLVAPLLVLACARPAASVELAEPTPEPAPTPAEPGLDPAKIVAQAERPSEGMIRAEVFDVLFSGEGAVVLLTSPEAPALVLPIFVGEREASAIVRRAVNEPFVRPLTHDLLEKIMARTEVSVVKVEVDAIEDATYKAYLYLFDAGEQTVLKIDARPSDSIVLSAGSGAPLYVGQGVFDRAGEPLDRWEQLIEGAGQPTPQPPPAPSPPP